MNSKRGWFLGLLTSAVFGVPILGGSVAQGAESGSSRLSESLLNARFYAWGAVGTPAVFSPEELAARDISKKWSAVEIVQAMSDANAEGRLYLLCVLRRNFPASYESAKVQAGFAADQKISVFSGNVLRKVLVSDVVRQIEASACEPLSWRL